MLGAMVRVAQPQVVGARFFVGSILVKDSLALLMSAAFKSSLKKPPRSHADREILRSA
jgi:hypothetical protein